MALSLRDYDVNTSSGNPSDVYRERGQLLHGKWLRLASCRLEQIGMARTLRNGDSESRLRR